jgi:hypothetical protein
MKKSLQLLVAVLLAGSASFASAQFRPDGLTSGPGPGSVTTGPHASGPIPPLVNAPPVAPSAQLGNCDSGGCWGTDGARYNRAGDVMFGNNGKICNIVSPGAPAICS